MKRKDFSQVSLASSDEKNKVFDKFTHLTNFSVNKKNAKFFIDEKNGRGFKWTLAELKKKLEDMGINHN